MEEGKTYAEKLQDPRWQQKRLRVMERDEFTCQACFNTENMLTVHHKYYIYKKDPWDYPDEVLVTLCEECHKTQEEAKYIISDFTKVLMTDGYLATELVQLLDLIRKLPAGVTGMSYIHDIVKHYNENIKPSFSRKHGKGSCSTVLHQ